MTILRDEAKLEAINRPPRSIFLPEDDEGRTLKISEYFGVNVFDFRKSDMIPEDVKEAMIAATRSNKKRISKPDWHLCWVCS